MPTYQKTSQRYGIYILSLWILQQSYVLHTTGWSFFQNVNLIFHEAGHTLFLWTPRTLMLIMGSGFEVLVPLCITYYFWKKQNPAGTLFGIWWTGTALWSAGRYIGDALDRKLPLITGESDVYHDWYNISLSQGWLYQAEHVGSLVYFLGTIFVVAALCYTLYLIGRFHNWV